MLATIPRTEELKQFIPKYIANREGGMDAGHLAEELRIPLKDVISFLIEERILVENDVDLELLRVLIRKNPDVKNYLVRKFNVSSQMIDRMLLTLHNPIVREIWEKRQQTMLVPFVSGFAWFLLVSQVPIYLILQMLSLLFSLLMTQLYVTKRPDSTKDLVLKALGAM